MVNKYSSYLSCKDQLKQVEEFLSKFFEKQKGRYNHEGWITFKIPKTNFYVNLLEGKDQPITQNMTFEIECDSIEELEEFAKKYQCEVKSFIADETGKDYKYSYIEVFGPKKICKIDLSYSENVD